MEAEAENNSSTLSGEKAAELFAEFRQRVSDKRDDVLRVVDAFASQDPEAFFASIENQIGDGAFDTALSEAFDKGDIEPELYHGMMYSLLEAASCTTEHDADGHSLTTTELFALPITGSADEIREIVGNREMLASLAKTFSATGYVSEGVQVILSPATVDPRQAARLRCAIAHELADAFVPHFVHGYSSDDATDLCDFIHGGFAFLIDPENDPATDGGRVTLLIIGATRRIHSTSYPTSADAFIANFIDENHDDALHEISDRFLDRLNKDAPGTVAFNLPMSITRGAAFSALESAVEGLNDEAALRSIRRQDFLMDAITITRHGDVVSVEGEIEDNQLGPVIVPDLLVRRDRMWFRNSLSRLCDDLHEATAPVRRLRLN
ncbi:hypothetical protein G6L37_02775 [Agrobacterium rubi]|nr:hypothetical protein [Agrobacterium rubi]NTF24305.1 hypothetical protein [Agrobacterium rubi]